MNTDKKPNALTNTQVDHVLSLFGIPPEGVLDTSNSVSSLSTGDAEQIRRLMVSEAQRLKALAASPQNSVLFVADVEGSIGPKE